MKFVDEISFKNEPLMIASWPGMGNVGIIATDYLRKKANCKVFAEIDMSQFFTPESIVVKEGIAQLPDLPSSIFYYRYDPDMIIFESNAQVGGKDGIAVIKALLNIAGQFSVRRIFTAAAYSQPMSFSKKSAVLCACNSRSVMDSLKSLGVSLMPDGYIAGLNGLMLAIAASHQIDAACFLGTIPSYATNISYPKASLEIIRLFSDMLKLDIGLEELAENIKEMDKQFSAIEDRIKSFFPSIMETEEHKEDIPDMKDDEVPDYILNKIEKLFDEVKRDRSKANELKEELVRWKLFDLYEHRFLDIFKDQ